MADSFSSWMTCFKWGWGLSSAAPNLRLLSLKGSDFCLWNLFATCGSGVWATSSTTLIFRSELSIRFDGLFNSYLLVDPCPRALVFSSLSRFPKPCFYARSCSTSTSASSILSSPLLVIQSEFIMNSRSARLIGSFSSILAMTSLASGSLMHEKSVSRFVTYSFS